MGIAIRTEGLTKVYYQEGEVVALDHLDLEVNEGEIFGFLGPNGAGKTTTIKLLLGLIYATEGSATVLGQPAGDMATRQYLSYLPESPYFYDYLTGGELLDFYGRLFKIPAQERARRADHYMDMVGLGRDKAKQLKQYSKGMLQRIGIAQALLNDPKLLIFDEPTSGLDPVAQQEIRDLIEELGREKRTVFLCSHQLADVEQMCDRIAILNFGKLVRQGKVSDLLSGGSTVITATDVGDATVSKLQELSVGFTQHNGQVLITVDEAHSVNDLVDLIRADNGSLVSIVPQRKRLEEVFRESVAGEESRSIRSDAGLSGSGDGAGEAAE